MLRYPRLSPDHIENLVHASHTDVGTLTILFASDYGPQFQDPATQCWEFVEPRAEHAVINLGDSMRFLSGMLVSSCLHRVVPFPGESIVERFSLAYFMRPEYDARFADSNGRIWASIDWHDQKYRVFGAPLDDQRLSSILTGKDGYTGPWSSANAAE